MSTLFPSIDPEGLYEYSVVFTDRSLNHMSSQFKEAMRTIQSELKEVYQADHVALIPGSGSYGMEALVRQILPKKRCLTLRNGFFNYRWTQIIEASHLEIEHYCLKAQQVPIASDSRVQFAPTPIQEVKDFLEKTPVDYVLATHVETASGIALSEEYIQSLSEICHHHGALLIVDAIASGALWLNMRECGIDFLLTAPQKGWSSDAGFGIVLCNQTGYEHIRNSQSDSFCLDLNQWFNIMEGFQKGQSPYYCTPPTMSILKFAQTLKEAKEIGYEVLRQSQFILGCTARSILQEKGYISVATHPYEASSILVYYTDRDDIQSGQAFIKEGVQIAAGVPLVCDEPQPFKTFRLGLIGLDKLIHLERTVELLEKTLDKVEDQIHH